MDSQLNPIVLMRPYLPAGAVAAVADVLGTRWIGQGPRVDEFESTFSAKVANGRPCVAVNSCTSALHLAYILAGIKPGRESGGALRLDGADEVIVPVFTCTATNMPLLWMGAKIRFADIEPDTLLISPESVARLITPNTKAIVAVHYGGAIADVERLQGFGLPVIEDCAQALGAPVGTADFACYSFQAVKHITTGDGGMLSISRDKTEHDLELARRLRWFGIDRRAKLAGVWENDICEAGFKYQMTDIAAALGSAGLRDLDHVIERRSMLLATYRSCLHGDSRFRLPKREPNGAAWLCTVFCEEGAAKVKARLAARGIESDQVHYRNDRYSIFADFRVPGSCPNMDAVESKYLCLPLHPLMTVADVDRVCAALEN